MMEIMVSCRWWWRSWQCFGDGDQRHKMMMAISCPYFDCMWCLSFMHLILLSTTVALWDDPLLNYQSISVLPEYAPLRKFFVLRHHVMIGCDRLYVQIQRVKNSCTRGILRLYLTSLAYTDMASEHEDRKVERESYSRYDQHSDVYHWNYSISRDDRTWFSWYGSRDHLED